MRDMLLQNNFPAAVIDKLIDEVYASLDKPSKLKSDKLVLFLNYINEQCCRKVYAALRSNKLLDQVRVVFKRGRTLKEHLVRTKMLPTECNAHVIYACYMGKENVRNV